MFNSDLNPSDINDLIARKLTLAALLVKRSVSYPTLLHWLKSQGISFNTHFFNKQSYLLPKDEKYWYDIYVTFYENRCLSLKEIAQELKIGYHSLSSMFKKFKFSSSDAVIAQRNINKQSKMKKSNMLLYGVEHPLKSKDIKDKVKRTNLEKYGTVSPFTSDKIKEKIKRTNLEKYGVENPFASNKIKEKIKRTNLEKYGVENPLQCEDIKNKVHNTNLAKYGFNVPSKNNAIKQKMKEVSLLKYGVSIPAKNEDVKKRIEQTNLKKYGFTCSSKNEQVKEKMKQTNLKKYGFTCSSKNEQVKEKMEQTNLEKYGVKCVANYGAIRYKIQNTNIDRYGVAFPFQNSDIREKVRIHNLKNSFDRVLNRLHTFNYELLDDFKGSCNPAYFPDSGIESHLRYRIKHISCGTEFVDDVFTVPRCPKCFPLKCFRSQIESFYGGFVSYLIDSTEFNAKNLIKSSKTHYFYDLDTYIPDLNIAFEFNGLYYHSIHGLGKTTIRDKYYHKLKTEDCLQQGIKLYHIWEHQDTDIIKSMIKSVLGKLDNKVYARDTVFKQIESEDAHSFIDDNHLFGFVASDYYFGLYDNDNNLVSLMSFKKLNEDTLELSRFCSLLDHQIIGGFSKLLKNVCKLFSNEIKHIVSYIDCDWSPCFADTVYCKSGFKLIKKINPSMKYTNFRQVWDRRKFQKHKLRDLFPDTYSDDLTEQQILAFKGIYPLYNSGNFKCILDI